VARWDGALAGADRRFANGLDLTRSVAEDGKGAVPGSEYQLARRGKMATIQFHVSRRCGSGQIIHGIRDRAKERAR
jgi:hypothetical protein